MLNDDSNTSLSEEVRDELVKFFDKHFTEIQKQHIFIIGKYDNRRRELTFDETIVLFETILKEEQDRLTKEEKDFILDYLEDEEEIVITEEEAEEMQLRVLLNPWSVASDEERARSLNSIINAPCKDDAFRKNILNKIDENMSSPNMLRTNILFFKFSENKIELTKDSKISLFKKLLFREEDKLSYEEQQDMLGYFLQNNIPLEGGPIPRALSIKS